MKMSPIRPHRDPLLERRAVYASDRTSGPIDLVFFAPAVVGRPVIGRRDGDAPMTAVTEGFPGSDAALATLLECDRALARIGPRIRVLKAIDWPVQLEERFLTAWR